MYRRNASGTTPKLTHFMSSTSVDSVPEEDEDLDQADGEIIFPFKQKYCKWSIPV